MLRVTCTVVFAKGLNFWHCFPSEGGLLRSSLLLYPTYYPRTTLSLPVVTQTPGQIAGSLPPPPHYGTFPHFYRENNSEFSSLVDSRQIVPTHAARRFQQLILYISFLKIQSKSDHGENRNND